MNVDDCPIIIQDRGFCAPSSEYVVALEQGKRCAVLLFAIFHPRVYEAYLKFRKHPTLWNLGVLNVEIEEALAKGLF